MFRRNELGHRNSQSDFAKMLGNERGAPAAAFGVNLMGV